ncbi:uncharacterized protein L201_007637 [Kwoniella dendrophila CBS 6074]|uniref:Class III aminotransferase n=1 Tax=Kwoniella dendrophila CBS 6074 TaxID=1295534 RepID=A0AAX4K677_9TREE
MTNTVHPFNTDTDVISEGNKAHSTLLNHTKPQPIAIEGSGLYFMLEDGRKILDAISGGAAVNCLGNGNKELTEVFVNQINKMAFSYHQSLGNEAAEGLANYLVEKSDEDFKSAVFLNSGSEAVEAAIKLAREYWVKMGQPQRTQIISRFPSYHGTTLGALGVGNIPSRRDVSEPLLAKNVYHVTSPQYKRQSYVNKTEEEYSLRLSHELEEKILEIGSENIIGFIAEPVVGAALGVMPPPKGYFPLIKKLLNKYGLLLIFDEVMSGSGRSGGDGLFAYKNKQISEDLDLVKPDILTMAKGLGSGYVCISSVLSNEKITNKIRESGGWKNSHTYQNHPVNCAVARKVLEIFERDNLITSVNERGEQLISELKEATRDIETIFDVRGRGLFVGVELIGSSTLTPRLAARVKDKAFENGLLIMAISGTIDGVEGESVILAPAYTVTKEQISEIVRLLAKSIKEVIIELDCKADQQI